ncbi:MAG: flagellar protein FlgN [Sinimarinibacterium sp.]|jgi:flagellar biosynthesis/type III secretory pathway chaperone
MTHSLSKRVADHLSAHLDCARLLETALQEEHGALLANDVAALEKITQAKSAASERLDELGNSLQRLRGEAGAPDIDALLTRSDPGSAGRWKELIELARRCAGANRDNAVLLDARSHQIRNALRLIHGNAGGSETYGRGGNTASAFGPRSLGSA